MRLVSFQQADNIVVDAADFGFASLTTTTKDQGIARVVQKMVKQAMEKASKQLPPDAVKRFKFAKRLAAMEQGIYQRTIIKRLVKESENFTPESTWNMIKGASPENIKLIRSMMEPTKFVEQVVAKAGKRQTSKKINEKTFWKKVQGRFLDDLIKTSEGDVRQKAIINKMDDAVRSGRMKALFPGKEGKLAASNFKRLAEAKNVILKPNPTGRAGLMVQFGQPGALIGLGAAGLFQDSDAALGSAAIFLLPEAIALMMTSRNFSKWLINQSKARGFFNVGTRGITSLMSTLNRDKIDFEIVNAGEELIQENR